MPVIPDCDHRVAFVLKAESLRGQPFVLMGIFSSSFFLGHIRRN